MDNHPIPQDVTGFQFKLIGSMTVKQFGYVAIGVVLAVITWYALDNKGLFLGIVRLPIMLGLGGTGAALAFVPIEGRPIDVLIMNLFKALFSPTQYLYHKQGQSFAFATISLHHVDPQKAQSRDTALELAREAKLQAYLQALPQKPQNALDQKEAHFLQTVLDTPLSTPNPVTTQPIMQSTLAPQLATPPQSTPPPVTNSAESTEKALEVKEATLEQQLQRAKQNEAIQQTPQTQHVAHLQTLDLENQLKKVMTQKEKLEQEISLLRQQLPQQPSTNVSPLAQEPIQQAPPPQPVNVQPNPISIPIVSPVAPQPQQAPSIHSISQAMAKSKGVTAPDVPNVIVGIIKDARGNVLSSVLVEITDKEGNPIRAFKTNPLGQFASATPLTNGEYTITFEDPKGQHSFDRIDLTVNSTILPPLEIISHDAREALRQELFT